MKNNHFKMIKNIILYSILFFLYSFSFAQSNRIIVNGIIKNSSFKPIANSHIVNLTTKIGTISNKHGKFTIPVKEGDWLQISNIQYLTKKFRLKNGNLKERTLLIYLSEIKNELEEVFIKKKMKGSLALDRINKRKDSLSKIDKDYYNFSKMDLSIKKIKNLQDKSDAQYHTDPTMKNVAVTLISVSIPNNSAKKKQQLRNQLNEKINFPKKILKKYGNTFFSETLKIPKDKYYHFLSYCDAFDIEKLFKEGKHLELLKILLKESKSYRLILEKNK